MPSPIPDAEWHAKTYGAYDRSSSEAVENAICTYNLLTSLGWTLQAMCAVYGNIEAESGYNPWRWEGDNVPSSNESPGYGYGFPQFTPSGKYINSSEAQANEGYGPNYTDWQGNIFDGDSQLRFIDQYADYDPDTPYGYNISYEEFKTGEYSPEYLAKAWLHNYERPRDQSESVELYRASIARHWYDLLIPFDPSEPIPPEGGGGQPTPKPVEDLTYYGDKFKIGFYLKPHYKRL